jgi:pilus assembly protein CpaD
MTRKHLAIAGEYFAAFAPRCLVLASLGATLVGCETAQEDTRTIWSDYRQRHPISIVEKDRTLEVFVGGARNGLTPEQRAEVLSYAQTWRDDGTGRFVIDQPSGVRNTRAAAIALSEIRSILVASGIPSQAIKVRSYRVAEKGMLAVIKVNYPHLAAQAGPCGEWPDDLGPSADKKHFENVQYWNLGCATQRNLAAMVANPADLVQPRAEAPIYAARRATVLEKYRKGESPATTYPDANKGAISDLGK